ncbi:BamA/TamA family outer membrane protein [Myxococcus sp. K15C18031901]|uniref:BamA/TamA family outer membrane protein n=1 Tax=Myxococcus dinghuensis TaxID=2906761 RepID=UPI0020A76AEE|nr:BamA/TamA family outer membrane protein [Myxococcus dinghuensis]MCP3104620.1 BamA/TamA family outer membrane protein [Myxococcus dinghuensis]
MLCPPRMNRLALIFCLASLAAGAQPSPQPGSAPAPQDSATAPGQPAPVKTEAPTAGQPGPAPAVDAAPQRSEEEGEDETSDASTEENPFEASASKAPRRHDACEDEDLDDEADSEEAAVLAPLQLTLDGRVLAPGLVELHGLQRLSEKQVRAFVGHPTTAPRQVLTPRQAQALLRRLAHTGLFARVEPHVRVPEQGPAVLEVHLTENPIVTGVSVEGLQDLQEDEVLEELFRLPPRFPDEDDEEDDQLVATLRLDGVRGTLSVVHPCPPPRPPREWLARMERGKFRAGVALGGVSAAMQRALVDLRDQGYLLASLSGTLTPDGRLTVKVDEGRLDGIDVVGVDGAIAERVRGALDLKPGDVFLRSDARRAMDRLQERLPFLEAGSLDGDEQELSRRRAARIVEEQAPDGVRHYHTEETKRPERRRRERVEFELNWRELFELWAEEGHSQGVGLEGSRLVVHVRPRRPDLDVDLLPVHTQVTGFAPGLSGKLRIWDSKDRVHTTLDAAAFIPLRLGGQRIPDDEEGTKRQRRPNLLAGAKLRVPAAGLAELGAQVHDFTDTLDRWRMSDIDSSIYSFLINRPDRDYFRRKGFAGFATWRWSESFLAGVSYHDDRYQTLRTFSPPLTLFRRDSTPFPNTPVSEGRFKSVVVRLEYASNPQRSEDVGSLFRTPETPLLDEGKDTWRTPSLRSLVTLEVGEGPAAGGADERFWKLVGDFSLVVPTGWNDTGLRLRLRGAGGERLPEQKREALGGWSALRGFGFKEYRGDASVLASAEYRWNFFGLFADIGTVHQEDRWTDARIGLGTSFHFSDDVRVDVAWRTDEKATATPEARLFFVRTF